MKTKDITILLSVDDHHLNELTHSYKTWIKFKNEIKDMSCYIMYDSSQISDKDKRFNNIGISRLIPWDDKNNLYTSQREKMLTALVFGMGEIQTPWFLKIDTDAIATNTDKWMSEDWFDDSVFISNPWGYTKPADAIPILDKWANEVLYFKDTVPLNLFPNEGSNIIKHKRIISWMFFGQTEWGKEVLRISPRINGQLKLPFPSQDTYLFYVAKRKNKNYKRIKFKKLGWDHVSRFRRLKEKCKGLLDE